jgi:hypothetical protein
VEKRLAVVFDEDPVVDIRSLRGLQFLYHLTDQLLVLRCICSLHGVPILSDDHQFHLLFSGNDQLAFRQPAEP